ncbi:MAG TPA: hypothetical protein VFC02_16975, partial [Anaerolineales bacterium]|nr:hypothetical protein [Anaerolineales bacterium]
LGAEITVVNGGGSQTSSSSRWGDYSSMDVDPSQPCTFWYTTLYYASTSEAGWRTRIVEVRIPECRGEIALNWFVPVVRLLLAD